jgi:3',5'-cyclic AMP phosphodiesterase CpdA
MTTILHVSDLHFGPPAVLEQIDALRADIASRSADVVAVSGDIAQRAKAGEFQCGAMVLREAREHSAVITVPGNHDVAWWYAPVNVGDAAKKYESYQRYINTELEPVLEAPGVSLIGLNTSHGITPHTLTWNMRDLSIIGDITRDQFDALRAKVARVPAGNAKIVVMHHNPIPGLLSQRCGRLRP